MVGLIVLFSTFPEQALVVLLPLLYHRVGGRHRCGRRTGRPDVYQSQQFDGHACCEEILILTATGRGADHLFETQSWYLTEAVIQIHGPGICRCLA